MKRDMDLIRRILLEIEAHEDPNRTQWVEIDGYTNDQIQYHLKILYEGGFIDALDASAGGGIEYQPRGLTWDGHEFLDTVRSDSVWNKTKALIGSQVSSVSMAIIQEAAKSVLKGMLGLPPG